MLAYDTRRMSAFGQGQKIRRPSPKKISNRDLQAQEAVAAEIEQRRLKQEFYERNPHLKGNA